MQYGEEEVKKKGVTLVVLAVTLTCVITSSAESRQSADVTDWSPGRITHMVLAVVESALLTLVLVFPTIMDPIIEFINKHVGHAGSRRRREVQTVVTEQAATLHNLFLDALDQLENIDTAMNSLLH
ncbi:hypothetical protein Pcinc_012933 [Petrolisthes cinctipes]|uniref:Uncharacterized protein n=1 Tax=Petrolisthes cinctipes TaxID=88211 RepID=A0AAE1KSU0_PETCI|nr:hypothetical protein Pcinc_012933 [Petrolisthes cinctipes]